MILNSLWQSAWEWRGRQRLLPQPLLGNRHVWEGNRVGRCGMVRAVSDSKEGT